EEVRPGNADLTDVERQLVESHALPTDLINDLSVPNNRLQPSTVEHEAALCLRVSQSGLIDKEGIAIVGVEDIVLRLSETSNDQVPEEPQQPSDIAPVEGLALGNYLNEGSR